MKKQECAGQEDGGAHVGVDPEETLVYILDAGLVVLREGDADCAGKYMLVVQLALLKKSRWLWCQGQSTHE